ncbi:MAG: hypothetical protein C0478_09960 [Planctomyces sp.]|nr:hypothetical protein [Planctomyces sp.]
MLALAELIVDAASCKSHAPGEPTFTHHGHQLQQSSEGNQAAYILGLMKHDDLEFKEYLATPPNKLKDQLACLGCATVLILLTIFVVIPLFVFYGSLFDGKFF